MGVLTECSVHVKVNSKCLHIKDMEEEMVIIWNKWQEKCEKWYVMEVIPKVWNTTQ